MVFGCPDYLCLMFIRKKKNKSGSTSIQIIKKINRSNKVLKTVGCSSDPDEIENLFKKALYELPRLYGDTLFDHKPKPLVTDLENDSIRVIGPELIFGKIFDTIGFNQFNEPLLRHLVLAQISHPGSKLKLSEYLTKTGKKDISVYSIYRFLDKLNNRLRDQIEELSFNYSSLILGNKIGVVFYDMTTIYFEASEPDDFRIPGFSKEGKHQHPQIMLGLLVGKDGYPLGYKLFEGITFEGHTLLPVLEEYISRFKIKKPIVIADSGLLNKSNIELLITNGFQFILGARIKNETQAIIRKIMNLSLNDGQAAIIKKADLKLCVSYSEKRAKKDKFNRERGLKRLQKSIKSKRLTKANINNRGYNKFLKMQGEVNISIDYEKIEKDAKWDGLKGYLTNTSLSSKEIVQNYNNLWKIEKAFRISKTDLKIRPVFHRLKHRIEAHIAISFMSYLIYKELERVLEKNKYKISPEKAIEQINKMYEAITDNNKTIRLKNNSVQQKILNIIEQEF